MHVALGPVGAVDDPESDPIPEKLFALSRREGGREGGRVDEKGRGVCREDPSCMKTTRIVPLPPSLSHLPSLPPSLPPSLGYLSMHPELKGGGEGVYAQGLVGPQGPPLGLPVRGEAVM